jgi:hypothetical protein
MSIFCYLLPQSKIQLSHIAPQNRPGPRGNFLQSRGANVASPSVGAQTSLRHARGVCARHYGDAHSQHWEDLSRSTISAPDYVGSLDLL